MFLDMFCPLDVLAFNLESIVEDAIYFNALSIFQRFFTSLDSWYASVSCDCALVCCVWFWVVVWYGENAVALLAIDGYKISIV